MPRKPVLTIKSISYGRTFNNGNYESSRIELVCDVLEGDDPNVIFDVLVEQVGDFRDQEIEKSRLKRERSR